MATSGSFTGARGGDSNGPYLTLNWSRIAVDQTNNKSQIRLTLSIVSDYSLYFSTNKTGVLYGSSFTYTSSFSGTGTKVLKTMDVWITHDSNGSKSQAFSASFNINVNWNGTQVSALTVSGTANLDAIARGSDLTAFSLSNSVLNVSTANTINYTIDRKLASYTHVLYLHVGNTLVKTFYNNSTGAATQSLTAAEINTIIELIPTTTTGTLRLTLQTMNGSSTIGVTVNKTLTFSLNSAIAPTITGLSVEIDGTGRDKTINKYVQGVSKVKTQFVPTPGYGATITNSSMTIKRKSDGGNAQVISGNVGVTPNPLALSGVYTVATSTTDSRGRSKVNEFDITVEAYSPPKVNAFTVARRTSPTSTVNMAGNITWNNMGTSNPGTLSVKGVNNVGTTATVWALSNNTTGAINTTVGVTGQSDSSSYTYNLTFTDSFGNAVTATAKIGVSFVEMSIAKGKGVGVAKIHEQGALDVAGDIYATGLYYGNIGAIELPTNVDLDYFTVPGFYCARLSAIAQTIANSPTTLAFSLRIEKHNGVKQTLTTYTADAWETWARNYYNGTWGKWYKEFQTDNMPRLWVGSYLMTATHTVTPSKALKDCKNGWLLMFSLYSGGTSDSEWSYSYIPKVHNATQKMHNVIGITSWQISSKYLQINNDSIVGNQGNDTSPRGSSTLRAVFEW